MHTTRFLMAVFVLALAADASALFAQTDQAPKKLKVAAIVTYYGHNTHAEVIVSRLLLTDTLDGKGKVYPLELASLYVDQSPDGTGPNHFKDISHDLSAQFHFPIYKTIPEALTLGTGKLAVDAVIVIGEHGDYPLNATGNKAFPKRRFMEQVYKVFQESGRVVPVYADKHLADNWEDINWIYTTAKQMHVPLMAGSSVPLSWRRPEVELPRGADLQQLVIMSYGAIDAYGFHALEAGQAIAERRRGGESGVKSVRTLRGAQVWAAMDKPEYDPHLFEAAINVNPSRPNRNRPLRDAVPDPVLFIITHQDGLKEYVFHFNGVVDGWTGAWKTADGKSAATLFWLQEARPNAHFSHLDDAITTMFLTGKPIYPVERTVLTSGTLDALFISMSKGGQEVATPYLKIPYQTDWNWTQPPPPPPDQPG